MSGAPRRLPPAHARQPASWAQPALPGTPTAKCKHSKMKRSATPTTVESGPQQGLPYLQDQNSGLHGRCPTPSLPQPRAGQQVEAQGPRVGVGVPSGHHLWPEAARSGAGVLSTDSTQPSGRWSSPAPGDLPLRFLPQDLASKRLQPQRGACQDTLFPPDTLPSRLKHTKRIRWRKLG